MDELDSYQLATEIRHALRGYEYVDHYVIQHAILVYFESKYIYIKDISSVLVLDSTLSKEDAAQILYIAESKDLLDKDSLLDIISIHKKGLTL